MSICCEVDPRYIVLPVATTEEALNVEYHLPDRICYCKIDGKNGVQDRSLGDRPDAPHIDISVQAKEVRT